MKYKRILIVDDMEIDREILRNILKNDFEVMEASNGYSGLVTIFNGKPKLDAVLLDISMPIINGFDILQQMRENQIDVPVFLITAEATKENVRKAAGYGVSGFISKPFEPELVLQRVGALLKVETTEPLYNGVLTSGIRADIDLYASKLKAIYINYLKNNGQNDAKCLLVSEVMKMVLREYAVLTKDHLDSANIEVISQAAYFYNIGKMTLPDRFVATCNSFEDDASMHVYHTHTTNGAAIINLNEMQSCRYFVQVCRDMCMHHHERYDGKGFPHMLKGEEISPYTRLCRIIIDFHEMFFPKKTYNYLQFESTISDMRKDIGAYDSSLLDIFVSCQPYIISYYIRKFNS